MNNFFLRRTRTEMMVLPLRVVLFALSILSACGNAEPKPAHLAFDEEICTHCRMAISQRQFASQSVTRSGAAAFFDDIGCLIVHREENPPAAGTVHFFCDYDSGEWVRHDAASFVLAEAIPSPMGYGLAAFSELNSAEELAEAARGTVLDWEGLLRKVSEE